MTTSTQPPPANSPNATPRLRTCTSSSPGNTPSRLPNTTFSRTSAFVAWSATTTATATAAARSADLPEIKSLR